MTGNTIATQQLGQWLRSAVETHGLAVLAVVHGMTVATKSRMSVLSRDVADQGREEQNKGRWNYVSMHSPYPIHC